MATKRQNTIEADNPSAASIIADLKTRPFEIPSWDKLKKEYYPCHHPVMDKAAYPDKVSKKTGRPIPVTRVTRALQRRATKTMAGLLFGIPVKRIYTYNKKDETEKKAAALLERIFTRNRIDSINIERAKLLYASCEVATLWYAVKQDNTHYGEPCKLKLRCKNYSPMLGHLIYPCMDEYDDMVALSFEYKRKENGNEAQYFDTYTAQDHRKWRMSGGDWQTVEEDTLNIGKIPGIYAHRDAPVWEDQSENCYEIERTYSRNGNYLRRNSVPVFEVCTDETVEFGKEEDDDERVVLKLPSGATSGYKTWEQAIESLKFQTEGLENGFFTDLQLPNISFDQMKNIPASGESRKWLLVDSQMKVGEEKGLWLEYLDREINVVRAFAKQMFPKYATAFDAIEVECIITPFTLDDESTTITDASTAAGGKAIASRRTAIERLGWADDPDEEVTRIEQEEASAMGEPTL